MLFGKKMTSRFAPVVLSALLALGAPGAAKADYVGGGFLTNPYGCEEAGWPNYIEMFRARYIPSEVQGRFSDVVLDLPVGGTFTFRIRGALTESRTWRAARAYSVWGALYRQSPNPRIRVLQRADAISGTALPPSTQSLRLSLRIRNFNGRAGCTVDAHMMLRDEQAAGMW